MITRFLPPLLFFAVLAALGQRGLFGPVTVRLKAGDLAPDLVFTQTLNAPDSMDWSPANLSGKITALVFLPDTTHNLQAVTAWNALIEQFSGKPVQFVWITAEKKSSLLPWLSKHPVHGWVFLDSDGQTGRAYGLEQPQTVFIGTGRKIIGFDFGFVPAEDLLNAVLEGRITTTPVAPGKAAMKAFLASNLKLLQAEPFRMEPLGAHKPDFAPSYTVHVSPSQAEGSGNFGGDDYFSLKGYDLKTAIRELYGVNPIRLDLPAALDDGKRYDFALVLPQPESHEQMRDRLREGLQDYFHVTVTSQERLLDVYVVTAPNRKPPALPVRTHNGGYLRGSSIKFLAPGGLDEMLDGPKPVSIEGIAGVAMEGTAEEFCHLLEGQLNRPVVNETNLQGEFMFSADRSEGSGNDFLERLRDQSGIVITPAQRTVKILTFEPR
jgi:uncharacterized protein (TIGR03435 family)